MQFQSAGGGLKKNDAFRESGPYGESGGHAGWVLLSSDVGESLSILVIGFFFPCCRSPQPRLCLSWQRPVQKGNWWILGSNWEGECYVTTVDSAYPKVGRSLVKLALLPNTDHVSTAGKPAV